MSESDRYLSDLEAPADCDVGTFATPATRREVTIRSHAFLRRVPLTMALLALRGSPFSAAELRAQAPRLESTVDTSVKPGDDFFAYANGAWLKTAVIPSGRDRWSVRDDINERTRRQIATILDDARTAPAGSLARNVADFRAAYLDESAIERRGVAPLEPLLTRIDRVADRVALARLLGSTMRADVDPLNFGVYTSSSVLGLSVEHSIHGEGGYTAFLLQGGLALGDREQYLSKEAGALEQRHRYEKYIARMFELAGFDNADARAASVLALETAIAETHATRRASAVDRNADHQWLRAAFAREAPGMDWAAFFDAAGLGAQKMIVAWQPSAVMGVAALVGSRPVEVWKDYLRFHTIDKYADVLPRAFAEAAADMRGDRRTREAQALAITESAMADAIGALYAKRYFSPAQKTRVEGVIRNVAAAFRERVARVAWLSPASRQIALAKLERLYVGVGYPESGIGGRPRPAGRLESGIETAKMRMGELRIDPVDALGNMQRVAERNHRQALARLAKPFDRHEWVMTPQTAGAVLTFQQNAYTFSAALLQPPKYDSAASDAATYGAIGAIIGHDMTHFVDVLGAEYEPDGRMQRWWTSDDSVKFEAAAQPLVRQFSGYEPLPGLHVDGRLTRTENVADLAGLAVAFDAYRKSLGSKRADRAYVRRADREFFIAFAQAFGVTMNELGLRAQLATDHAPEMYRFDTVRNLDAWYDAFDVVPGQRLYVEPSARVRIW